MRQIAFQGDNGAFSQEAIFQTFGPETATLPCVSFQDIFRAVSEGRADLGFVPIENSTAGAINQSYDLLLDYDLPITREVVLRVRHTLMARPGVKLGDIKRVYSHPAALAQCERFIASHGWEAAAAYDTAGAAKQLAANGAPDAGVIASETAARLYALEILVRDVQDLANNYTRFVVIAKQPAARSGNTKTSLVFATKHIPGALHACLGEFASRGINLTKIESRPDRRDPWHYIFYVDVIGHIDDPELHAALEGLGAKTSFLQVLGSFPAASLE